MNQTVALVVIVWAMALGLWFLGRAVLGPAAAPSTVPIAMLWVAVTAWLATGLVAWVTGTPPARPVVFAGYAITAVAIVPVGTSMAGRLQGRQADLVRAVVFVLLAFLCYRSEAMFL
ncbi:hypothetical protein [Williamsia sp.]|uniref:hypothetical protein n=1 Tax=Williamsia sp. TaxID=1872085 RepID=UPI001A21AF66|nr:hypothetical protein [Williamsia sp.]MBJ7291582.1 hypothetical protein [Williamsia sp.]